MGPLLLPLRAGFLFSSSSPFPGDSRSFAPPFPPRGSRSRSLKVVVVVVTVVVVVVVVVVLRVVVVADTL